MKSTSNSPFGHQPVTEQHVEQAEVVAGHVENAVFNFNQYHPPALVVGHVENAVFNSNQYHPPAQLLEEIIKGELKVNGSKFTQDGTRRIWERFLDCSRRDANMIINGLQTAMGNLQLSYEQKKNLILGGVKVVNQSLTPGDYAIVNSAFQFLFDWGEELIKVATNSRFKSIDLVELHYNIGEMKRRYSGHASALWYLQKADKMIDDYPEVSADLQVRIKFSRVWSEGHAGDSNLGIQLANKAVEIAKFGGLPIGGPKSGLAWLLYTQGQIRKAYSKAEDALKSTKRESGCESLAFAEVQNNLACILGTRGNLREAFKQIRNANKIRQNVGFLQQKAEGWSNEGVLFLRKGDYRKAARLVLKAEEAYRDCLGRGHEIFGECKKRLIDIHISNKNWKSARNTAKEAIEILQPNYGCEHSKIQIFQKIINEIRK